MVAVQTNGYESKIYKKMNTPKIVLFDIETMANTGYTWGKWEQNLIAYKQHGYLLGFGWKYLGARDVTVRGLPDYKGYKPGSDDDEALARDMWKVLDDADVVIAHNGNQFDVKRAYSAFLKHGMTPPRPFKQIDTKLVAKKVLRQDSNSLDDLCDFFKLGRKLRTGGFGLWLDCEKGDKRAWKLMKEYNRQDVLLLEKVYLKMLPFITNHPNYNMMMGTAERCPNCGSHRTQRRGYMTTQVSRFARFQCQDCAAWSKRPIDPDERTFMGREILR
jgi:hypothetical protein